MSLAAGTGIVADRAGEMVVRRAVRRVVVFILGIWMVDRYGLGDLEVWKMLMEWDVMVMMLMRNEYYSMNLSKQKTGRAFIPILSCLLPRIMTVKV